MLTGHNTLPEFYPLSRYADNRYVVQTPYHHDEAGRDLQLNNDALRNMA